MIESAVILAVIMGLSEVIKRATPNIDNKYTPLLNLFLGVIACIVWGSGIIKNDVLQGLLMGLSASGLYDATFNVFKVK